MASGPSFAYTNGLAFGRSGSLAYRGRSGPAVWPLGALPFACTNRPGSRPGFASTNGSGVWAVREPGILGPIRPLGLAPRSRGICLYKSTARPTIWIAILVEGPGRNLPILLARPQYWVQDTWQISNLACQSCQRYRELKYLAFLRYLATCDHFKSITFVCFMT